MFSKISRYRGLPAVAVPDAQGRVLASSSLRLLPAATGVFQHAVEEFDRLDHLAYKYYDQPRDWWRIADANPGFLSPLALLGHEPRRTLRIPLGWAGPWAPWAQLLAALRATPGVEAAHLGTEEHPEPDVEVVQGPLAFTLDPALTAELDASVLSRGLTPPLEAALSLAGAEFSDAAEPAKADAVTWRVTGLRTRRVLTVRHFPDEALLNVYESALHHHWTLSVTLDTLVASMEDLLGMLEARGFGAGPPAELRRIGKPITIPPRRS